MATPYNHRAIEQKWRKIWEEHPINVNDGSKEKYYCLDMFPYPSGNDRSRGCPSRYGCVQHDELRFPGNGTYR